MPKSWETDRDVVKVLLKNAWLTDGAQLFVRPEVFNEVDASVQFHSGGGFKWARQHSFIAEDASLDEPRIMLQKRYVLDPKRRAFDKFTVDPARVEFSDPDLRVAFDLLSSQNVTLKPLQRYTPGEAGRYEISMTADAYHGIDPQEVAVEKGWVTPSEQTITERQVGHRLPEANAQGCYILNVGALEQVVGLSQDVAQGNTEMPPPVKTRTPFRALHVRTNTEIPSAPGSTGGAVAQR